MIAGLPRDTFIAVMCAVGFVALTALVTAFVLLCRSGTRSPYLKTVKQANGGGSLYHAHDGGYYLSHIRGSIASPSTVGDFDSVRNVRSPSLTPSLLVPVGADSLVSVNINGEKQSFVAVPVEAAARAIGRSASVSSDVLDAASARSSAASESASDVGQRYRSQFARRGSSSKASDAASDNGAFSLDSEAREPPSRRGRTATASSGGRLESIGEELSLDQEPFDDGRRRSAAVQPQSSRVSRFLDRSVDADRREAAAGAAPMRRMTLPAKPTAYYDAPMTAPPPQRYSADGRSFTYEGSEMADDYEDEATDASVADGGDGEPPRWPYASHARLPRTSWTGADLAPSSAFPVKKQGWLARPPPRRQSAL